MDYASLIYQARSVARPIYSNDNCQAGTVGAVIVSSTGQHYTGICLDFSCSLGFCAEHAAIADMLKHHETQINHVVAVHHTGRVMPPCGRCREMMWQLDEVNKNALVILSETEARPLADLLPFR
jgi:cytidine deaminase